MTDREKLIEILTESFDAQYNQRQLITPVHTADHLLANGVVILPCKVGDTVWVINRHMNAVFENTVISLSCGHSSDLKNNIKTRWMGSEGMKAFAGGRFGKLGDMFSLPVRKRKRR